MPVLNQHHQSNILWIFLLSISSLWYSTTTTRSTADYMYNATVHVSSIQQHVVDDNTTTISISPPPPTQANPNATTLALLFPTGLVGGYRNQAMRFIAFVHHAVERKIDQILLPSLVWSTRFAASGNNGNFFWPVPFSDLLDVEHWNMYHEKRQLNGNATSVSLPLLVESLVDTDCWQTEAFTSLEIEDMRQRLLGNDNSGKDIHSNSSMIPVPNNSWMVPKLTADTLLQKSSATNSILGSTPTRNATLDYLGGKLGTAFRRIDYRSSVQNCRHPRFHGGGTAAGVLWNEISKKAAGRNTALIATVQQALIPAPQWRQLATQCLQHYLGIQNDRNERNEEQQQDHVHAYVVLHARVERDMMVHRCGRDMEMNLTKIFDMVDHFIDGFNKKVDLEGMIWKKLNNDTAASTNNARQQRRLQGTMVAVGREGMQDQDPNAKDMIQHNWKVLNQRSIPYHKMNHNNSTATSTKRRRLASSIQQHPQLPMFECGDGWVQEAFYNQHHDIVDNYYGDILPSILNFWLAVQADVFVGVMKSSWSNDVWRTRYHLGKGHKNYQYVSQGDGMVIPVPNGGLPPPHNC